MDTLTSDVLIAQISDVHLLNEKTKLLNGICTWKNLQTIVKHLQQLPNQPKALFWTGDISEDGSPESYHYFAEALQGIAHIPSHFIAGNHDNRKVMEPILRQVGTFEQPLIDIAGWQILQVNSVVEDENFGWLAESDIARIGENLSNQSDTPAIVFLHHNAVPTASEFINKNSLKNIARFHQTLLKNPAVKGVFFGHIHSELHIQKDGIDYFATPAISFQIKIENQQTKFQLDSAMPGFRLIQLSASNGQFKTEVVRVPIH